MVYGFFLSLLLLSSAALEAQQELPDSAVKERLRFITQMLEDDRRGAFLWWYGWLGAYGAATVGQGAAMVLSDNVATRQDMAVGAATTFLGAAGQLIAPLHPGRKADLLRDIPESTPEERRKKLEAAEEYLRAVANTEKFGRSWKTHALFTAVNLTSGLVTWIGFKRSVWAGIGNFALNSVVSEIQIWTQPTRSLKNWREYCSKFPFGEVPVACKPRPEFHVGACPGGLSLRLVF